MIKVCLEAYHMKKETQQIIGYIVGGSLVLVIIPFVIYSAAKYFGLWSIVLQNTIGKGGPVQFANIEISPKTQNLIVSGPYKYTRNPMLFGACLVYFGFSVYLNSITTVILVILFMIFTLIFVKLSEEKRLLKDFGKSFEEYRGKTSMFIPCIPKK